MPSCHRPFLANLQAGAFLPKDPTYAQMLIDVAVEVPTLFVCGQRDKYISPDRSEEVIATFQPQHVQRFRHDGGHMVPTCTGDFKRCLQDFLDVHKAP